MGAIILIIGGGVFVLTKSKPVTNQQQVLTANGEASSSETTLFYGDTCPHCKDVEEFLQEKPAVEQKITIIRKEIYQNQDNARELVQTATVCGLNTSSIGVPFLVDKGQCFMGKEEVINQLKVDAGLNQ